MKYAISKNQAQVLVSGYYRLKEGKDFYDLTVFGLEDVLTQITGEQTPVKAVALLEKYILSPDTEVNQTMPSDLEELLEDLERKEKTKLESEARDKAEVEALRKRLPQQKKTPPSAPTPLKSEPEPEAATQPLREEVQPPIKQEVVQSPVKFSIPKAAFPSPSPAGAEAAKGLTNFVTKIATAPVAFAFDIAGPTLHRENPVNSTAVQSVFFFPDLDNTANFTVFKRSAQNAGVSNRQIEEFRTLFREKKKETGGFVDPLRAQMIALRLGIAPQTQFLFETQGDSQGSLVFQPQMMQSGGLLKGAARQLFGQASSSLTKTALSRVFKAGTAKVGAKIAATKVAGVVAKVAGIATGPLGWVASLLISTLPFIKKNFDKILGGILIGGGVLIGGTVGLALAVPGTALLASGFGMTPTVAANALTNTFFSLINFAGGALIGTFVAAVFATIATLAIIIFIIQNSAFVVPPGSLSGLPYSGPGGVKGCEGIVQNSITITNSLSRGFWDYYNRSSMYDDSSDPEDHFDEAYFASFPHPCTDSSGTYPNNCQGSRPVAYDLFWCTVTPMKAYELAGFPMPQNLFGTVNMKDWFESQGRFLPESTRASEVPPGSAVFFGSSPNPGSAFLSHVAVITEVTQDYVTIVESNNAVFTRQLTVSTNGTIQGGVAGFGLPPAECQ